MQPNLTKNCTGTGIRDPEKIPPGFGTLAPHFSMALLWYLVLDIDLALETGGTEGSVNEDQVGRVEPKVQPIVLQDLRDSLLTLHLHNI
jgi:hypothetical protein